MSEAHEDIGFSAPVARANTFACGHPAPPGLKPPAGRLCSACDAEEASRRAAAKVTVRRELKQFPPLDADAVADARRRLVECGHTAADADGFLKAITTRKSARKTRGTT